MKLVSAIIILGLFILAFFAHEMREENNWLRAELTKALEEQAFVREMNRQAHFGNLD